MVDVSACHPHPVSLNGPGIQCQRRPEKAGAHINQEHQAALKLYLVAAGHGFEKESPLFLGVQRNRDNTNHLTQRYLRKMLKKYVRQVGLSEKVTPHSAKATFITEALNAWVPVEQVQNTVDHKNISTAKMYDKRRISYQ